MLFLPCVFFLLQVFEGQNRIKRLSFTFLKAVQNFPPKLATPLCISRTQKHVLKDESSLDSSGEEQQLGSSTDSSQAHLIYWKHKRQILTRQSCLLLDKQATYFQFSLYLLFGLCHDVQIDIKYLGSIGRTQKAITCKYHQSSLRTEQRCGTKSAVLGCAVK